MNTLLLTGASGEVGFETFGELLMRRDRYKLRILCLDRKLERKMFKPFNQQVDIIWGDLRNETDVEQAVDGVDAVVHVAAMIPPVADHFPKLAWDVNVRGTKNLLAAMKKQDPAPRLVYTSSVSVYGDRVENPEIRVGDPLLPSVGDEYAKTKIEAEKLIQQSGLKWTILRLCGILTKKLKIQPLMFHMPLETSLEWCHSADAGYALAEAVDCEGLYGRIFNLGGGEKCRVKAREFMRSMMPMFGIAATALPESAFATKNFHSGDYVDGDELDRLIKFRRRTLKDYYETVKRGISPMQRLLVGMIPAPVVQQFFMRMSEPLRAIRVNDLEKIKRYYGSRQAFRQISRGA
ncbi:MAG: NAD(P)-dependent oxidoreductase [Anaerolineales bacterium]|nr:NAD(P)-dependent oxidoreductase [Chloroflexota bacterium]MBL6982326.1 NAD(P)-dependent oxidoreductase [Anaerolineales bacterium]